MAVEELSVKITGDASDLTKATADAAKALSTLNGDIKQTDAGHIEITPELDMTRINRDMAKVEAEVDGLDGRKVTTTADLDITELLRDEGKIEKELGALEGRKIEITADIDETGFMSSIRNMKFGVEDLTGIASGGGLAGLSTLAGRLGGAGGTIAGLGIGATIAAVGMGKLAADNETLLVSLNTIFDDGEQALSMLRDFSNLSPFGLPEVASAALRLGGAGLALEEIPETLTALGDAASALNAPLDQVVVAFAQMTARGRVTNEELQQLADANIPAQKILADAMGVTVGELEDMAAAGLLGQDALDLLRDSLEASFAGSMARQAETFNGKMSTLGDTFKSLGADIGELFLPAMKRIVDSMIVVGESTDWLVGKLVDLNEFLEIDIADKSASNWDKLGSSIANAVKATVLGPDDPSVTADKIEAASADAATTSAFWANTTDFLNAKLRGEKVAADAAAQATEDWATATENARPSAEELTASLDDLIDNFSTIRENALDDENAFLARADAMKQFREEAKGSSGSLSEFTREGNENRVNLAELLSANQDYAASVLQATGSQQKANAAWRRGREDIFDLAKQYGIGRDRARKFANEVGDTPRNVRVKLEVAADTRQLRDVTARIERLKDRKVRLTTEITPPSPEQRFLIAPDSPLPGKVQKIDVQLEHAEERRAQLTDMVKPREAKINPLLSPPGVAAVNAELNALTAARTVTITPVIGPTQGSIPSAPTGPTAGPTMILGPMAALSGPAAMLASAPLASTIITGGAGTSTSSRPNVTRVEPKQPPTVKVYLDGEEIADRLVQRVANQYAPAGRGRRRA